MAEQKLTPVGRLVQGDLFEMQTKGFEGKDLEHPQLYIGLAIPKTDPEVGAMFAEMTAVAQAGFPHKFVNGQCNDPTFSWKYMDGDAPQHANKEGFAGHWVFRFTSGYPSTVYKRQPDGTFIQLMSAQEAKRGDYIRVQYSVVANGQQTKSGLFMNLGKIVEHIGYGQPIIGGPSPDQVLAQAAAMPQGASATPIAGAAPAPSGGQMPQAGGAPAAGTPVQGQQPMQQQPMPQAGQQPMQQQPVQGQMPMQQAPVQGQMPQAGQQPMQQQMPQAGQQPMQQPMQQAPVQQPVQQPMQQAPVQGQMPQAGQQPMQQQPQGQVPQGGTPVQGQMPPSNQTYYQ